MTQRLFKEAVCAACIEGSSFVSTRWKLEKQSAQECRLTFELQSPKMDSLNDTTHDNIALEVVFSNTADGTLMHSTYSTDSDFGMSKLDEIVSKTQTVIKTTMPLNIEQ